MVSAERCGPRCSMRSWCLCNQSLPQSTGHPWVAYFCNSGVASCAIAKGGCGHISPCCNVPMVCFVGVPVCRLAHAEISCWRSSSSSAGESATLRAILRGTSVGVPLTSAIDCLPGTLSRATLLPGTLSGEGWDGVKRMSDMVQNQVPGTHPSIPVGGDGVGWGWSQAPVRSLTPCELAFKTRCKQTVNDV